MKEKHFMGIIRKFQFQYGAIKGMDEFNAALFLPSFNSNMVRLKAQTVNKIFFWEPFQFQYGAIKGLAQPE